MYAQVVKPKENRSRAVANFITQKKSNVKQGFGFVDNRPAAIVQHKLQRVADNKTQLKSLKSTQKIIQKYQIEEETGYLISQNERAILRSDGTKDLYLRGDGLATANTTLNDKNVTNLELEAGGNWNYLDTDYTKVVPEFSNPSDNRQGKVQKEQKVVDTDQDIDNFFVHGFKLAINFLSSCSQNPWYRDSLNSHAEAVEAKDTLERQLRHLERTQNDLIVSVDFLRGIRNEIDNNIDKGVLKNNLTINLAKITPSGTDVSQKLIIYASGDTIEKDSILADLDRRVVGMEEDIVAYNEDTPYLPTSCGYLKDYLLEGSDAEENGGAIGDYHFINYADRDDNGPWNNHYASIIFADDGDTVTIEDAAGQARVEEKSHWYYKMYGTEEAQTFDAKTNAEYERRRLQNDAFDAVD